MVRYALLLVSVAAAATFGAWAAKAAGQGADVPSPSGKMCPNPGNLAGQCVLVNGQTLDPNPISPKYKYLYERYFFEAACADPNVDSPEVLQRKMAAMWIKYQDMLRCTNVQFELGQGSIMKFAVAQKFDRFIWDIVQWGVPLNLTDPNDHRTILDYTDDELAANRGNALESTLQQYHNFLVKAGAKHVSELEKAD